MTKVLSFSRAFPVYHPRKGEMTNFIEKIWACTGIPYTNEQCIRLGLNLEGKSYAFNSFNPKFHTIRAGHRWKAGDWFKPVVWSGAPYRSKQIQFAPDMEVQNTWDFKIDNEGVIIINNKLYCYIQPGHILHDSYFGRLKILANNDGLTQKDFLAWFKHPKPFDGQIICWDKKIIY